MSRIEVIDYAAMVDELAALKATVSPMEDRMEAIKDALKAGGQVEYNGTLHTARIIPATRKVPATDLLKEHFGYNAKGESLYQLDWCYDSQSVSCKLTARKTR